MFQFATATQIVFGAGALNQLTALVRGLGRRAWLVLGERERERERVQALLEAAELSVQVGRIAGEPSVEDVLALVHAARAAACDLVVGVGGGSVIDAAKALAALLANPGDPLDFLEVVGRGRALGKPSLPARALRRAFHAGDDREARSDMALVSLFGGLSLANAKLGAVHGFAGPIGGRYPAPHGAVCARLLPLVVERNILALRARAPEHPSLARYADVARILTGRDTADALDAVGWLRELVEELAIPRLGAYGLDAAAVPELVDRARASSSMQGNPLVLTPEELTQVLSAAI